MAGEFLRAYYGDGTRTYLTVNHQDYVAQAADFGVTDEATVKAIELLAFQVGNGDIAIEIPRFTADLTRFELCVHFIINSMLNSRKYEWEQGWINQFKNENFNRVLYVGPGQQIMQMFNRGIFYEEDWCKKSTINGETHSWCEGKNHLFTKESKTGMYLWNGAYRELRIRDVVTIFERKYLMDNMKNQEEIDWSDLCKFIE